MVPAATCVAPAPTATCPAAVTTTAGRSSCRVSWFMAVRVSWFENGARVRRGSTVAPRGAVRAAWTRTREKKTRRKKQAAAQVATRIGTRKSPEGESSPLRGTSPGHFQRARPGNLVSCKFATEVRESPGLHRHAQMAAVATRPPLQSRGSLLRGACEFPNSSWGDQSHPRALPRLPTRRVRWNGHTIVPA